MLTRQHVNHTNYRVWFYYFNKICTTNFWSWTSKEKLKMHLTHLQSTYFQFGKKSNMTNWKCITITTVLRPFFRDHLGEPGPEENFCTLWCKGRLTEADRPTIRLGSTPSGLTTAHLHHSPFFYGPDALPATNQHCQSTEGKNWKSTYASKWTAKIFLSHISELTRKNSWSKPILRRWHSNCNDTDIFEVNAYGTKEITILSWLLPSSRLCFASSFFLLLAELQKC